MKTINRRQAVRGGFPNFGAAPASISFADTYSSLQTKVVDDQENLRIIISIAKLSPVIARSLNRAVSRSCHPIHPVPSRPIPD